MCGFQYVVQFIPHLAELIVHWTWVVAVTSSQAHCTLLAEGVITNGLHDHAEIHFHWPSEGAGQSPRWARDAR